MVMLLWGRVVLLVALAGVVALGVWTELRMRP